MSWQRATMKRDARPSDALHVWHVGIVIQVRVMLRLFLDDAEDTGRRLASLLAARYRRPQDPAFGVIYRDLLAAQRNDSHDRLNRLGGDCRLPRPYPFVSTPLPPPTVAPPHHRRPAPNGHTP